MNYTELAALVSRDIPKDSIGKYDLLPIFTNAKLFARIVAALSAPFAGKIDFVASPEALGWILGASIANALNVGFVPIRKGGKLPYPKELIVSSSYVDYSAIEKTLEIKKDAVAAGSRVLVVDEWIETGASMRGCIDLLEKLRCSVAGLATIGIDYGGHTKDWIESGFVKYIGSDI